MTAICALRPCPGGIIAMTIFDPSATFWATRQGTPPSGRPIVSTPIRAHRAMLRPRRATDRPAGSGAAASIAASHA